MKKERKLANIANNFPKLSFKKIALYFTLAIISTAPSCWDTGTDVYQGQLYLNGDFYIKHVNDRNDFAVTNYNCTWIETTRKVTGDIESKEEVTYTYECFERDEFYGYFTLAFVLLLPGMCQVIYFFMAIGSLEAYDHKIIGFGIGLGLVFLIPLFPLQIFLVKLLAFLTNGPEMKKIKNLMTILEAVFESDLQFVLQLYIIFSRADRQPSTSQILSLSTSIIFSAKSKLEENFADKPNEPILKKLQLLPQKLCFTVFICGSMAVLTTIFRIVFSLFGFVAIGVFGVCLSCICMKAKISQGKSWKDQEYKGMLIIPVIYRSVFFFTLLILLVLINHHRDMIIYSIELPLSAIFNVSSNQTKLPGFIHQTKLSDIALVKENWDNYVIPIVLISGVIYYALLYKQNYRVKETIQISKKDNQQDIYEIPRGALQDSPLEAEVVKVSVDAKTFIVPKDDLDVEKYPQELETMIVVKRSNEKDGCFKNLKKKVSCNHQDETPKPIKAYIVKIEDTKEMTVDSENNIDGQKDMDRVIS